MLLIGVVVDVMCVGLEFILGLVSKKVDIVLVVYCGRNCCFCFVVLVSLSGLGILID